MSVRGKSWMPVKKSMARHVMFHERSRKLMNNVIDEKPMGVMQNHDRFGMDLDMSRFVVTYHETYQMCLMNIREMFHDVSYGLSWYVMERWQKRDYSLVGQPPRLHGSEERGERSTTGLSAAGAAGAAVAAVGVGRTAPSLSSLFEALVAAAPTAAATGGR